MKVKVSVEHLDQFAQAFVQGMVSTGRFNTPKELDSLLDMALSTSLKYAEKRAKFLQTIDVTIPDATPEPIPEVNENTVVETDLNPFDGKVPLPSTEAKVKPLSNR